MHDALGPGALREGCENAVDLLVGLVTAARDEGLIVGPLSLENRDVAVQAPRHALAPEIVSIERER